MEGSNGSQFSFEAEQLMQAVDIALSATASVQDRSQAYILCENFKEESPSCATVGFELALAGRNPAAKHFGLQLIEHCIKFRWNNLQPQEKVTIKNAVWSIIQKGTSDIFQEASYIKDGIARLVVEMAKREWPQQWPAFLSEMFSLAQGPGFESQTELVLLVLLRLTEDVVTFQSIESQSRRRDLHQALTANMGEIFELLSKLLHVAVMTYQQLSAIPNPGSEDQKRVSLYCRLSQSVLTTLNSHVDWVNINHIMAQEGRLLEQFCLLLTDEHLRLAAAECLLQVVSRKGPLKERKPLLILYSQGAISSMLEAAEFAASQPLNEKNYAFLKRLAEVLVALGFQLAQIYGKEPDVTKPETFAMYLQALLALTRHPSPSINQTAITLWLALFRHEKISTDPEVIGILNSWVNIVAHKLIKAGFPSKNDHAACAYTRLDFESDDEFSPFIQRLRVDLLEAVRQATVISPEVMYSCAENWLKSQLEKPIGPEPCTISSPSILEWDALTAMLDCVVNRAFSYQHENQKTSSNPKLPPSGLELLNRCLLYETQDPLLSSVLLSGISAMFVFVKLNPARLETVLERILTATIFTMPGQTAKSRSRTVRNVRRHACSLMVKISRLFPELLLPAFDYLKSTVDRLSNQVPETAQLSRMERITLQEALLLISNQFAHFDHQSTFISEFMRTASEQWLSPAFNAAFESSAAFMSFVGLDKPPVEPSIADLSGQNRSELLYCMNVFLAVIKRCRIPEDQEAAARGGFVVIGQRTENGGLVFRHPAAPHLMPLLFNTFRLARVLHGIWEPQARQLLSHGYSKAYDILDSEVANILGQSSSTPSVNPLVDFSMTTGSSDPTGTNRIQTPVERMQGFLAQLHFNVFHFLGSLGETLVTEFYSLSGLPTAVAGTACFGLEYIPDYRLRPVIRVFCRPFITLCPPSLHATVLLPVLSHLCPSMLQRLSVKWDRQMAMHQQQVARKKEDDDEENAANIHEVVDDVLGRMLTRDYLDVLKSVLFGGGPTDIPEAPMDQDDRMDPNAIVNLPQQSVTIGELGRIALSDATLSRSVVQCLLSALWWPDTSVSMKAALTLGPIVKYWATLGPRVESFPNEEWSAFCLTNVLNGLKVLGQHDANLSTLVQLGVQIYDVFRPIYSSLAEVLLQQAQCSQEDLASYEEKTFGLKGVPVKASQKLDRTKRDLFRKMTAQVTGKHVGQLFRKPVDMAQLPSVKSLRPRHSKPDLIDSNGEGDPDVGLTLLFIEDDQK